MREILEITPRAEKNKSGKRLTKKERAELIDRLTREMRNASKLLEFEHAAYLRDRIKALQNER